MTQLGYLDARLVTPSFDNILFSQAYHTGNVAATSLADTLINIANVPYSSSTTAASSATNYGPVVQYRYTPTYNVVTSANLTKVYGTSDPLMGTGQINVTGSFENGVNATMVKNAANNLGWWR
jgi:hypothetical protein